MIPPSACDPWPILVLTGAGISSESGVPTFRGPDGLWKNFSPGDLATPDAFARDPALVWEWYGWRREKIAACRPNAAHQVLVEMEKAAVTAGMDGGFTLVTQNVDGLHETAGSENILRLHGSIWHTRCETCHALREERRVPLPEGVPVCSDCGGGLRPHVVWFGESLDAVTLNRAFTAARAARTVLVVGTSGLVTPAAYIPLAGKEAGARLVEINPERTPLSDHADEFIAGKAAEALPEWWGRNGGGSV